MKKLIVPMLRTIMIGFIALGIVIFLPAGTLNYWQGWVFIVVFSAATNALGLYFSLKDPALLERRMKFGPAKETSPAQKIIMWLILVGVLVMLVLPVLGYRFRLAPVSPAVSLIGDGLVVLGLFIDLIVMRENSFGGSTIETVEGQRVISSGPYALIRHPMYAGVLVMCAGIPLALGSWLGFAVFALTIPVLVWRILDEEKLLRRELPGYVEYAQKVQYRLVPYLW